MKHGVYIIQKMFEVRLEIGGTSPQPFCAVDHKTCSSNTAARTMENSAFINHKNSRDIIV